MAALAREMISTANEIAGVKLKACRTGLSKNSNRLPKRLIVACLMEPSTPGPAPS